MIEYSREEVERLLALREAATNALDTWTNTKNTEDMQAAFDAYVKAQEAYESSFPGVLDQLTAARDLIDVQKVEIERYREALEAALTGLGDYATAHEGDQARECIKQALRTDSENH